MTTIRTIEYNGRKIEITATDTGMLVIGGDTSRAATLIERPDLLPAGKVAFIWAGSACGLPPHTKIAFTAPEVALIKQTASAYLAKVAQANAEHAERARKEREWDDIHNEGGDGYNPYRRDDLTGTAFDPRERHYPEGA